MKRLWKGFQLLHDARCFRISTDFPATRLRTSSQEG
jgi:hypothetical protein